MGLKINRQANLDKIFNKFATDPLAKDKNEEKNNKDNSQKDK